MVLPRGFHCHKVSKMPRSAFIRFRWKILSRKTRILVGVRRKKGPRGGRTLAYEICNKKGRRR